jgi:type IV secretion system protein VirD4
MYRQVRPYTLGQQLEKSVWFFAAMAALAWAAWGLYLVVDRVSRQLLEIGWGKPLGTTETLAVLASCAMNSVCSSNLELISRSFDQVKFLSPLIVVASIGVLLEVFKRYPTYTPIAAGRWATRRELRRYLEPQTGSRLVGMLGLIPKLEALPKWMSGNWNHQSLALQEGDFNEHTLVYGPPGSGKTAGLFRPMLFRAALEGRSAVVFDVKFPDQRQGLYAVINEFRALERHVECFTPFAESSQSLDLFAGCEDFQKAVEVASIFVPLEAVQSDSSYYRNQERRLLAALFMDGKLKGSVRLDEICARLKGGIQALETFIKHNDHLLAELRTFLDLHNDKIAGIMTGLAATLEPFTKGSVPLRLSGHGRAIDLERIFLEPTLFYIGIPQADVIQGPGALMMRLVKRLVDEVGLRVAERSSTGAVPVGTGIYLDEVLNLGRLDGLENMLATLRSRGIGYVLGVQSHDQGRSLYSEDVWEAVQKSVRHKVVFLGALDPKDALEVSKALGEMTVFEQTVSESEGESGGRYGTTTKESKRSLVPMEEMLSWPQFHAVVIGRNLAPFKVFCCPLFDPRHPDFDLHEKVSLVGQQMRALKTPGKLEVRVQNVLPSKRILEDTPTARFELARIIVRAVSEHWACDLARERGQIVTVRLEPNSGFNPPSITGTTWTGKTLEIKGCDRIGEEFMNALVWLKRRTELEVWLQANGARVKGLEGYAGNPVAEAVGETLWMDSSAVAAVFGRAYIGKKPIHKRSVDNLELEVIEVQLELRGLEKLRERLVGLEAKAGITA